MYGVPFKCEGYGTSMKCLGLHICVDQFYMSNNDGKVFTWCGLHNASQCLQCLCGVDPQILKTVYSHVRDMGKVPGRQDMAHNTSSQGVTTQHYTTHLGTTQENTTLHNTTVHNTTLHYTAGCNTTQHSTTQHYTTQHNTT